MTLTSSASPEESPLLKGSRFAFLEDFIGRVLMLVWFTTASWIHTTQLITAFAGRVEHPYWLVDVAHSCLLIAFSALAALLTIMRRPAKAAAHGLEPRISALFGTFLILTLPFLPGAENGLALEIVSLPITFVGLVTSIFCMAWLGQSFSIMATARKLVVSGPYRIVRHPLYAAEMVAILGVVLSSLSLLSIVIFVLVAAFQIRRTFNEERVLRSAFPEYEEYARRVPRLIPNPWLLMRRTYAARSA